MPVFKNFLALPFAAALSIAAAGAQEPTNLPAAPVAVEAASPPAIDPPADAAQPDPGAPTISEDEMADLLNSRQQITQGVTLTKSVDGKVIETKKETIVYSTDDPLRATEAGLSPLEKLKAEFDSETLTRREALEEAKLDFVVADLDRSETITAEEFVFLVKGWQDADITGSGRDRFVDPYFHVDQATADAEHAEQARTKFAAMAGSEATLARKSFVREISREFDEHDLNDDELLSGDELLSFRASVRGEPIHTPTN